MTWSWRVRQAAIVTVLVGMLVAASSLRELDNTLDRTLENTAVEARLVAESVMREISFLSVESPEATMSDIAQSARVQKALLDAQVAAPSVVHVAVYDAHGEILAHTLPQQVGEIVEPARPLPEAPGPFEAVEVLWRLWRNPTEYSTEWPLVAEGDQPVAVIRVINAGAFLLHDVDETFRRGIVSIVVLVTVAGAAGVVGARTTSRRLRDLEASIVALREGRRQPALTESGWEEFDRVARELNMLGEQFSRSDADDRAIVRAVDLLGDGIVVLDAEGEIVLGNAIAWDRLGMTTPPRNRLDEVFPENHPLVQLTRRVMRHESRSLTATLVESGDGFVAVGHRIEDEGKPAGVLVEIKAQRAQAELHSLIDQSRVLTRLGQMAAGVAHELRGPLQGLEFDLEGLDSALDQPAQARHILQDLRQKVQRLEWVVTGFLKVARVRPLRLDSLTASELIQSVCDTFETEALMAGLTLEVEEIDKDLRILGDPDTLSRALENVVSNAIEARPSLTGIVRLTCRENPTSVEIAVSDAGPGIEEDRRDEIFDLYFTTKPHGTGVGLALVRQAVELHNGEVRVDSRVGRGTTVTLSLPAAPPV